MYSIARIASFKKETKLQFFETNRYLGIIYINQHRIEIYELK